MERRGSEPVLRNRICLGHRAQRLILGSLPSELLSVIGPREGPSRGGGFKSVDGNRSIIRNVFQRKTMGNVQNKVMFAVTKRRETLFFVFC